MGRYPGRASKAGKVECGVWDGVYVLEWKRYPYRCIIKLCEVIGNGRQFAVALQKGYRRW